MTFGRAELAPWIIGTLSSSFRSASLSGMHSGSGVKSATSSSISFGFNFTKLLPLAPARVLLCSTVRIANASSASSSNERIGSFW
jgi:hypothetical protein